MAKTRLAKRIGVVDQSGQTHVVEYWENLVATEIDGRPVLVPDGGKLKMNGQSINPTDDPNIFETLDGDKLTVISKT